METLVTTQCGLCKQFCGLIVHVENGRITKVENDKDDPMSQGAICPKALAIKQIVYHKNRITHPMMKEGGKWKRIEWDDALDRITEKLDTIRKTYGPEGIAVLHGTERNFSGYVMRFANSLETPNRCEPGGATCFYPRFLGSKYTFGKMIYYLWEIEPEYTNCMLIWGMNNFFGGHQVSRRAILDAQDRGAKLIVVDPYFSSLAAKSDLWLQLRPGTDDALALAMINCIIKEKLYDREFIESWTVGFDELSEHIKEYTPEAMEKVTWVPADHIRRAARWYATGKPSVLDVGVAIDQQYNSLQTARAVATLIALTGNVDIPGGNSFYEPIGQVVPLTDSGFHLEYELPSEVRDKRLGADTYKLLCYDAHQCHAPTLLNAILEGRPYPVKAAVIFGSNAVLSYPDSKKVEKALKNLDVLVVSDFFRNPTTELADFFLPAATFVERDHIINYYGQGLYLRPQPKVVEPVGQCWDDKKIMMELAKRLGHEKQWPWNSVEDLLDDLLKGISMTYEELKKKGIVSIPRRYKKYETKGFETESGKVEFYSRKLKEQGYDPLPVYREPPESPLNRTLSGRYPLILITGGRLPMYNHTEMRNVPWLRELEPEPYIQMHPSTAKERGIEEGAKVIVESPRGQIEVTAKLTLGLSPRVVRIPERWWFPEMGPPSYGWERVNVNVLTSSDPPFDPAVGSWSTRVLLCDVKAVRKEMAT